MAPAEHPRLCGFVVNDAPSFQTKHTCLPREAQQKETIAPQTYHWPRKDYPIHSERLTGGKQTGGNDICVATGITVYDVTATQGAGNVLASDCCAQFGFPSTRRGCRICVTVRLPVRPHRETMYRQENANTSLSATPLLNVHDINSENFESGNFYKIIRQGQVSRSSHKQNMYRAIFQCKIRKSSNRAK